MFAEYVLPTPVSMVCTSAVRTGVRMGWSDASLRQADSVTAASATRANEAEPCICRVTVHELHSSPIAFWKFAFAVQNLAIASL